MHFALETGKKRRGVRTISVRGTALCWAGGRRGRYLVPARGQLGAAGRQRGAAWGVSWLVISASRNSQQPLEGKVEYIDVDCMDLEGEEEKMELVRSPGMPCSWNHRRRDGTRLER